MEIWLDTINLEIVADAAEKGIIAGVTTNPSILSRTPHVEKTLTKLLEAQKGPVAVQVTSQDTKSMVEEGVHIFNFSPRMIVKVPVNPQGLAAMHQLIGQQIPVLATAVFHPCQALLAKNQGATYIAPYFSHLGEQAKETLKNIHSVLKTPPSKTKLLAASVKSLDDLLYCCLLGADAVTIKEDLYLQLIGEHEAMEKCMKKFRDDWTQAHSKMSLKDLLIIEKELGLTREKHAYHDLDYLAGTWSEADANEFKANTAFFEQIDKELWN